MGAEKVIRIIRDETAKLKELASKGQVDKAVSRGINYALKKTRTRMKQAVRDEYNLPASAVVASNNGGSITITSARQGRLCGTVNADISAESLAHFSPTWYKDVYSTGGGHQRGGIGGGHIKTSKRGAGYTAIKSERNTRKSGIYVTIVKDRGVQCIPGAFLIFKGTSPVVMARGKYQNSGKSHDFAFGKPRLPINKLNAKSVYWGVLHPVSVKKWEPETEQEMLNEAARQLMLLTQ